MKLEITETIALDSIPGASGIGKTANDIYMIGDNSPFLFKMDKEFNVISKIQVYSTDHLREGIIEKEFKPDFEALEIVDNREIIIFGSGSKSPERNFLIRVDLTDNGFIRSSDITFFYENLRQLEVMRGSELNIEAAAFYKKYLYLFNRGNNVIFKFEYDKFIQHVEGSSSFPEPGIIQVDMPNIAGIKSGFSGATIGFKQSYLLFTASVENTDNAYDDGEILGSFLGIVELNKLEDTGSYKYILIEDGKAPLKVESVAIAEEDDHSAELLFVTDSDGENSALIRSRLSW